MIAVAFHARGRIGIAFGKELTMPATLILLGHLRMTRTAIYLGFDGRAGPLLGRFHLGVALRARRLCMPRCRQLRGSNVQ